MSVISVDDNDFNTNSITYLDHAGATLPARSLLNDVFLELLLSNLGNPHSSGAFSQATEQIIQDARKQILHHFNGGDHYEVIFTSGTTAGIKLVGECFPWGGGGTLCYPVNAHTSLLGLRAFANSVISVPSSSLQQTVTCSTQCGDSAHLTSDALAFNLLAVPGECNFSGGKADLRGLEGSLIHTAMHNRGTRWLANVEGATRLNCIHEVSSDASPSLNDLPWLWLLDAAKLAATAPTDLRTMACPPHFVAVSFYKIFGYPTGLGVLLVRKDTLGLLKKRYSQIHTLTAPIMSLILVGTLAEAHFWLPPRTVFSRCPSRRPAPRCSRTARATSRPSQVSARVALQWLVLTKCRHMQPFDTASRS